MDADRTDLDATSRPMPVRMPWPEIQGRNGQAHGDRTWHRRPPAHGLGLNSQRDEDSCASCGARQKGVCSAMDDHDLRRLAAARVVCFAATGQGFIAEGDQADSFFSVKTGTARLFKSLPDGRRQITGFAGSGHFLGLAVSGTYAFSAEAIGVTQYCRFSRLRLRVVLDDFPTLERRLLELACNELVAAQAQMLLLGRKSARERVASFLVGRCHAASPLERPRQILHLPMTRGDIADYLGLTIETVSRTLTKLKVERVITIPNSSEIVILRPHDLKGFAGGGRVAGFAD